MGESFAVDYGKELFSNQLNSFFPIYSTNMLSRQPKLLAYLPAGDATRNQFQISASFSKTWFIAQFIRYSLYACDEGVMKC